MKRSVFALTLAALSLAGCAGLNEVMTYDAKSLTQVTLSDGTYRVFEHPSRDRLMVTPSVGAALGTGVTLGAAAAPSDRMTAAARQYLDNTQRSNCAISSTREIVKTQYEVKFTCA